MTDDNMTLMHYDSITGGNVTSFEVLLVALYPEYRAIGWIWKLVAPPLLLFGTVGNIICFAVLKTKTFRKSGTAFALGALALVDMGLLWTALPRQWFIHSFSLDLRAHSSVVCKLHFFATYYLSHLSSWTIVVISLERLICVGVGPFSSQFNCARRHVIIVWSTTAVVLFFVNIHFLWTAHRTETQAAFHNNSMFSICGIGLHYLKFHVQIWCWIDFALLAFVPLSLSIISTTIILYRIRQAKISARQHLADTRFRKLTSSTYILITVNVVFLLTTLPNVIYFLVAGPVMSSSNVHLRTVVRFRLIHAIFSALYYVNSSANFIMYSLSGSRFRRTLNSICCNLTQVRFFSVPQRWHSLRGLRSSHSRSLNMLNNRHVNFASVREHYRLDIPGNNCT